MSFNEVNSISNDDPINNNTNSDNHQQLNQDSSKYQNK